jgi:microsomal dipeptidase-like Zn-dependent dipeptidase
MRAVAKFISTLTVIFLFPQFIYAGGVDLHSHLFIEEGIPQWLYKGCFACPLKAKQATDFFASKINREELLKSDLDIMVASLYAHALGPYEKKQAIRYQIKIAKDFVSEWPRWVLATTPEEAQAALDKKKKVLILSLEGAHGVLESEKDFDEFLVHGPIRMVTPIHLSDDEFGGAALLQHVFGVINPTAFFKSLWSPKKIESVRVNTKGLTERGQWLIQRLIDHKIWVDLTHASDVSQMEIISMLKKAKQPLLYSHTVLREFHGAERGLAQWQIDEIKATSGLVGLLPSPNYLHESHSEGVAPCVDCNSACEKGFYSFIVHYQKLSSQIGEDAVMLGTDFNAPLPHISPGCDSASEVGRTGFWKASQYKNLWSSFPAFQREIPNSHLQTRKFLKLWSQVRSRP